MPRPAARAQLYRFGSLISVAVLAALAVVPVWLYVSRANVVDVESSIPLMALAVSSLIALPPNALRRRWGYAASLVPLLGLLALLVVHALEADHVALTGRTIATLAMAVVALVGLGFTVRALLTAPKQRRWAPWW